MRSRWLCRRRELRTDAANPCKCSEALRPVKRPSPKDLSEKVCELHLGHLAGGHRELAMMDAPRRCFNL